MNGKRKASLHQAEQDRTGQTEGQRQEKAEPLEDQNERKE